MARGHVSPTVVISFLILIISPAITIPTTTQLLQPLQPRQQRPLICLSPASVPSEVVPPPLPRDCTFLANTMRNVPGAAVLQQFRHYPRFLARWRTCQVFTDVPNEDRASFYDVADVIDRVVANCLLPQEVGYVGGITRIGVMDELTVWVTGIWNPPYPGLLRPGAVGNDTDADAGGVEKVDVT